jgi:Carbohydrate binding domain
MPFSFPSSPTNGQTYTYNGKTWTFNSTTTTWDANTTASIATAVAPITYNASTQAVSLDKSVANTWTGNQIFAGSVDENNLTNGVQIGKAAADSSPRLVFVPPGVSSSATNWQIDNFNGTFRWFIPGNTKLSLDTSGNLTAAGSINANNLNFAGKNAIINGAFDFWQRGTSFTNPGSYTADRFKAVFTSGLTTAISQQDATGATGLPGNAKYFLRITKTAGATGFTVMQPVEDVRTFAGQTVTLSFYAKADSAQTATTSLSQYFGSGGSSEYYYSNQNVSLTTSWQRFSFTWTLNSVAGKTVASDSAVTVWFNTPTGSFNIDLWGMQLEAGSVATPFSRAGGTLQGELAACQRFFQVLPTSLTFGLATNAISYQWIPPVTMRTTPAGSLTTTSPSWENAVFATMGSLTSASLDVSHVGSTGGDLRIQGTFSPNTSYGALSKLYGGYIWLSAEL